MRAIACAAVVAVLVAVASVSVSAQGPNEITNLPGAPANLGFRQYAGYVDVDPAHQRKLFYYFVESQSDPSTDPLVLWLNGGPGCSSLEGGFTENGPLYVNPDGETLRVNPNAWNQIANVIYLESLAGVGFSTTNDPADYTVGDVRTAADSVNFLHQFLTLYPQYQNRPFWVTGESYGGHYVPDLTLAIVKANAAGQTPFINIQGFQVGNAWTDAPIDNKGAVEFWWTHAMISDETHAGIDANCDFAHIGPLAVKSPVYNASASDACANFLAQSTADQVAINIYDVYTDVCVASDVAMDGSNVPRSAHVSHSGRQLMRHLNKALGAMSPYSGVDTTPITVASAPRNVGDDPDPCVDNHLTSYMNLPSVQAALHANITYAWAGCSSLVNYSYPDLLSSMLPIYDQLLAVQPPLNLLVYSGDVDGIVPITGTRAWLSALELDVVTPWHPWLLDEQTGGWSVKYDGLTFASVRNAGHMVPWTEPARSFALFSAFLNGKPI